MAKQGKKPLNLPGVAKKPVSMNFGLKKVPTGSAVKVAAPGKKK